MDNMNKTFNKQTFDFSILSKERVKIMGAAAIMIIVFHFAQMSNCFSGTMQSALFTLCGGVEIFVLMSGIGLYYSFSKNNNIKQFYVKRICNVYLIYLVITLPYIIWWSLVNKEVNLLLVNWMLPNYISGYARDVWYVPFAMVIYLLYPIVYKFLFSTKIYKYRFLLVSVFSVLYYIACFILYKSENNYFSKIEIGFFRFPIFLVSCLIGEQVYNKKECKTVIIAASVLSVVLMFLSHYFVAGTFGLRLTNAFAAIIYLVILALFFFYVKNSIINKCLKFFGSMSLELYLTHILIFKMLAYYGIDNWVYFLIGIIIAVIISCPLSKLRCKFVELSKKRLSSQIGVLCTYKLKLPTAKSISSGYSNGIFGDYMSIEKMVSIKGIFILIVFLSHAGGGYLILGDSLIDRAFRFITSGLISQSMAAVFMFYSGYGIMLSIDKKGRDYVKSIPSNRFFKVLLHFDIAVLIYYVIGIAMHKEYGFIQFLISLTGWESVGNSNWYIFDILVLYLITYVSFTAARNNKNIGVILNIILCTAFAVLLKYTKGDSCWYDTVLCNPAGMLFYFTKPEIERILQRRKWMYWVVLIALIGIFAISYKFSRYEILLFTEHILFSFIIVMLTMKFSINNKILNFFGTHLFSIYILQRIPMNILSYYGFENKYLFVIVSLALTIPVCLGFDWIIAKIDSVIFKNKSLAKN